MFQLPAAWQAKSTAKDKPGNQPLVLPIDIRAIRAERDRTIGMVGRLKPPITRVFDIPRLVNLAGEFFAIGELRLIDLAEWQAWIEDQSDHPLAGLPKPMGDDEPGGRMGRLSTAWDLANVWPPRIGTEQAGRIVGTDGGRAHFLWLCIKRHRPDFTPDQTIELGGRITLDDWQRLQRIAWGIAPQAELLDELVPEMGAASGTDWPKAMSNVLAIHPAWTFADVGNLTLTQWRLLGTGGSEPKEYNHRVQQAGRKVKAFRERQAAG